MVRRAQDADRQRLIEALKRFNEAATTPPISWQPQLPLELAFIELLPEDTVYSLTEARLEKAEPGPNEVANEAEPPSTEDHTRPMPPEAKTTNATAKEVAPSIQNEQVISLDVVIKNWPKLRELVARTDSNLPRLLASGRPLAMEGTKLVLGFEFPILKDRFDGQKGANATVSDVLGQILETNCRVETVLTNEYKSASSAAKIDDDEFAALADELGGIVQRQE
jgi:DNA polymerase III subunit tau, C-terminal domain